LGVEDVLRAEAVEEAERNLDARLARIRDIGEVRSESVIREGSAAEEIEHVIDQDRDIAILVLAASTSGEGPGPLVSDIAKTAGTFPIPVAIVPGHLADEDLEAMA
jgi:nucleotide-binding universal stress UspA family protein